MAELALAARATGWILVGLAGCSHVERQEDAPPTASSAAQRATQPTAQPSAAECPPQPAPPPTSQPPLQPEALTATEQTPCPPEMAHVGLGKHPYCIDRYEARLLAFGDDGKRRVHPYFERPEAGRRYLATSQAGVFPQAYISRNEASAACQNAGKRLCTRSEWQRACRHGGNGVYPYGNQRKDGVCNMEKRHLLPLMFPERNYHYEYESHFNHPALAKQPGFLAPTGDYAGCVSALGAFDMVGNLHEWVSDPVGQTFLAAFEAETKFHQWQPKQVGNGMFVGGFYSSNGEHGAGCSYTTVAHDPGYHDYSTGFRCCAEAR